jgi:predicted MFS family arabinose efflux permease
MFRVAHRGNSIAFVLIAAALIMSAGLGPRAALGLFVLPITGEHVVSVSLLAFAIAIQNLAWGAAQPLAGSLADRRGPIVVTTAGALISAAGMLLVAWHTDAITIVLGLGVLVGLGQSAMTFAVVISAVSRAADPAFRATAVALAAAGGSLGQVILIPIAQFSIANFGFHWAFVILAEIVLATGPIGYFLIRHDRPTPTPAVNELTTTTWSAIWTAVRNPNYLFLTVGFFACGFQLAFIGNYLPAYLALCHVAGGVGVATLATIGFFNIIGSFGFGRLMNRFEPQHLLVALYGIRATATLAFLATPPSGVTAIAFGVVMGLTWLGTVPLTSGVVTRLFGLRNLGTLFGVCFLGHQAGAFMGAFFGGLSVAWTGSFGAMWVATIVVGYAAALLNLPIRTHAAATA